MTINKNGLKPKVLNKAAAQAILDTLIKQRNSLDLRKNTAMFKFRSIERDLKAIKAERAELNRLIDSIIAKQKVGG